MATDVPRLAGRVVVVSTEAGEAARALAGDGAAIVIVAAPDVAAAAGALAGEIEDAGGRACVFTGDLRADDQRVALAEMLAELFSSFGVTSPE